MIRPDLLALLDQPNARGIALEDAGRSVTYPELGLSVRAIAGALARKGVSRGDRVAVMLPNSAAAVEVYLACALLGAIWVGINPASPQAERDRQCALIEPALTVNADGLSSLFNDGEPFDAMPPDAAEPCAIGFSSGTTGTPKALVHSRAAVSLTAAVLAGAQLRTGDRVGVILPMSIHNLIVVGALPALFAGATCVAVQRMNAVGVASACRDSRLTQLNALVPATIYDLVNDDTITAPMLSSLRFAGTGAAGLSESLRCAFENKFGRRLVGTYGMTEAPGVVSTEHPDEPHRAGASGKPLPHLTIVAHGADQRPLPTGQVGRLVVSAASGGQWADAYRPALGTWTERGLIRRSLDEKFLDTGDDGWIGDDGSVYVSGRKTDVIVRGGVNVNAAELEDVLGRLEGVRDIAVIGEHDERLGQRIVAFVESAPGVVVDGPGLRQQARGVLSHGKVPDEFVVGALPRNAMGKVARTRLRRS